LGFLFAATLAVSLAAPWFDGVSARLQNASFRLLEPATYMALSSAIPTTTRQDKLLLDALELDIDGLLDDRQHLVTSRVKSIYSLHRKMENKGAPLEKITDRLALRIQVQEPQDCYHVMALLYEKYAPIPGSCRDYIASPKANGYQSLHTAVVEPVSGEPVEIQVRTFAMHHHAEFGPAAHWRYKLASV
jgi:(p)ppGpp synthase/HD superfamily hydrolase